jgi:hypothetical protein
MSLYHCPITPLSRKKGRPATAASAYRTASKVVDERTGLTYDYRRRSGVVYTKIVLPPGVPEVDRVALWNTAERSEKYKTARTAREIEIALPAELDFKQRQALALRFAKLVAEHYGAAVEIAIHKPHSRRPGEGVSDARNHHAHLLMTTRRLNNDGTFGAKTYFELDDKKLREQGLPTGPEQIVLVKQLWALVQNEALLEAGVDILNPQIGVDHRSYAERGLTKTAGIHQGPRATAMERRGGNTEIGDRNREIKELNRLQAEAMAAAEELADAEALALAQAAEEAAQMESFMATESMEASIQIEAGRIEIPQTESPWAENFEAIWDDAFYSDYMADVLYANYLVSLRNQSIEAIEDLVYLLEGFDSETTDYTDDINAWEELKARLLNAEIDFSEEELEAILDQTDEITAMLRERGKPALADMEPQAEAIEDAALPPQDDEDDEPRMK